MGNKYRQSHYFFRTDKVPAKVFHTLQQLSSFSDIDHGANQNNSYSSLLILSPTAQDRNLQENICSRSL